MKKRKSGESFSLAWERNSQAVGCDDKKCLSKLLLEDISIRLGHGDHLTSYRKYLSTCMGESFSYHQLADFDSRSTAEQFYLESRPEVEPKFFSINCESDLSRLEKVVGRRIVIIVSNLTKCYKYHDKRVFDQLWPQFKKEEGNFFLYILRSSRNQPHTLYRYVGDDYGSFYKPKISEECFSCPMTMTKTGSCMIDTINKVLNNGLTHSEHEEFCTSKLEFCCEREKVYEACGSREFIIATHVKTKALRKFTRIPRLQTFSILTFIRDSATNTPTGNTPVLCMTSDQYLYILRQPYADAVRSEVAGYYLNREHSSMGAKPKTVDDFVASVKGKPRRKPKALYNQPLCECEGCRKGGQYVNNMSTKGPQTLIKCDLSLLDFVRLFNLDQKFPGIRDKIARASKYSLASFDIETRNYEVHHQPHESLLLLDTAEDSNQSRLPKNVRYVQKILMIGLNDAISLEKEEKAEIFTCIHIENDGSRIFKSVKEVVQDFLSSIERRRDRARREKTKLLSQILEWLETYKRAHFDFYFSSNWQPPSGKRDKEKRERSLFPNPDGYDSQELDGDGDFIMWCDDDKKPKKKGQGKGRKVKRKEEYIIESWKNGLFGKFEYFLRRLLDTFLVQSFNGSNFDNILLHNYIVTCLKEKGYKGKIFVQRQGSSIRRISISRLIFNDVKLLLSGGFSLDSFCRTCNLPITKGIFPFWLLRSNDEDLANFLSQPCLPESASSWTDPTFELRKKPFQQQEVDEAVSTFACKGGEHENVYRYLRHYLEKDTDLLLMASLKYFTKLESELDVNYVAELKLTIPSLANKACQLYLTRNKYIGFFFPNNCRIYSVRYATMQSRLTVKKITF